jgi:hypothetical protein
LFITEDSSLTVVDKHAILARACRTSDRLEYLGELSLFNGDKKFSYYRARQLLVSSDNPDYRAYPCPYPAMAWIDYPVAGDEISGLINVSGWAYNEDIGVVAIRLLVDNQALGSARYGSSRVDVVEAMVVESDPNAPNLGFDIDFDTRDLANGRHELAIEILNAQGATLRYGARVVNVSN